MTDDPNRSNPPQPGTAADQETVVAGTSGGSGALPSLTGNRVGRYLLQEALGEGGFGVVYRAQQSEPVQREVAFKIIKLGMDTRQVIARFEAERQALALMDHPHIAKVFDAGATEQGRPYFVMELVRGIPLTEYCDQHRLPLPARLELFIQVCKAVQHAHQKGIIHRDLKPGNILVAQVDGKPVPKVIDFGISKATEQPLTASTVTHIGQFVGTPAYMSPEQADPTTLDIDTRSDVYALGVILYELLTGAAPLAVRSDVTVPLEEIKRAIREEEPPRPSTRVTGQGTDSSIAAHRQIAPRHLREALRGDLDCIIMMALEKDRSRRYQTAIDLAADLNRYLCDEPVLASPPSRLYRMQKFLRRNRGFALGAASLLALILLTLGITTTAMLRAWEAESDARDAQAAETAQRLVADQTAQTARVAAARSQQVATFLRRMLASVGPAVAQGRDTALLREILEQTEREMETALGQQPEVRAELNSVLVETYLALGEYDRSKQHLRQLTEHVVQTHGPDSVEALDCHTTELEIDGQNDISPEMEARLRTAITASVARAGEADAITIRLRGALGHLLLRQELADAAIDAMQPAYDHWDQILPPDSELVLRLLNNIALAYSEKRDFERAIALYERALSIMRPELGDMHPQTVSVEANLALCLLYAGRFDESETLSKSVLARREKILGRDHRDTLISVNNLGLVYAQTGRREQALVLMERDYETTLRIFGPDYPDLLVTMVNMGRSYQVLGRNERATEILTEAEPRMRRIHGPDAMGLALLLHTRGAASIELDRLDAAQRDLREALRIYNLLFPPNYQGLLRLAGNMITLYERREAAGQGSFDQEIQQWQDYLAEHEE